MKRRGIQWMPLLFVSVIAVFFIVLYYKDNKYQTPPPYGKSGMLTLTEQDLERSLPIYLIDGWLLSDRNVTEKPVYIGEFSNLQRRDPAVFPHGNACYQLSLQYEGEARIVAVDFPELSMEYTIFLDDMQLAAGEGNGRITFLLTRGVHVLRVETFSEWGYYSGMYFPPALGTVSTLQRIGQIQGLSYASAVLMPLALAVFSSFLWWPGERFSHWFCGLCCCFVLYMIRYFVFLFSLPAVRYWFWIQSLAFYCLCFCVLQLTALASGAAQNRVWKRIRMIPVGLSVVLLILGLFIPILPWAVLVHARLTDVCYMLIFGLVLFLAAQGRKVRGWQNRYTLTGCLVFGAGLLLNILCANRFEPMRFFWQFEWCGLFLVLLFGAMMITRNRSIKRENDLLKNHLEEQVKKRTEEVSKLLEERKAFFSDMAHDLKAPVFATQSFIEAIRKSGVGVDRELRGYLDQAEAKQQEMARRLQGLSMLNTLDKITEEQVRISVREMLTEIWKLYHGEAEVQAVHFLAELPAEDAFLMAQPEKMEILFENLFYNALRAAPRNGSITVSAETVDGMIRITMEDTGCGIPQEELPFLFRRFYVGSNNRKGGTGLGLYIVHSIVTELGGTISVYSTVGKGTKFVMEFPEDR